MDANDKMVQYIILKALKENPNGLTTKQIQKIVRKKLKKIKKVLDILNSL